MGSHSKQAYLALLDDPLDGIRHHVGVILQAATQYSGNQQKQEDEHRFLRLFSKTQQTQWLRRLNRCVQFLQNDLKP